MNRLAWMAAVGVLAAACGRSYSQEISSLRELFREPVALKDTDGNDLVTGKAEGSPYAADFDADGVNDLLLNGDGCMDVMYSSGVFEKPEVTKVYVMYGKVRNVRLAAGSQPAASQPTMSMPTALP